MPEPIIPSQDNLRDWRQRTASLASQADMIGLHHDLYTVMQRIDVELGRHRTIQGGCAYRVLRLAKKLREFGDERADEVASNASVAAYDIAFELVAHENEPSPGWKTMCAEFEFPHKKAAAND